MSTITDSFRKIPLPALLLGLAIFIYAIGFSYLTVTRYAAFEARALDLGNLHQTVWNTANGRPFHMTNQPDTVNRLSLHVEPILLPIALLYWIHDGPETLLILQSIVVALGALPLYALADHRLRNRWLALSVALVYLLNPTIQAANWLEFHPVTLAPTLLMATFYFLVRQRHDWFALFAILAAACKEEIGLLLFMMGLYALFVLRRPKVGLLTMGLTLSWSLIAVLGIQQYFADGNIHWGRYDYLGASPAAKVLALITEPRLIWQQLTSADALGYCRRLLWPVGFLALVAPEVLLLALPSFAINLLADFSPMHQVFTLIYAAPILPFVMLAMVEGIRKLQIRLRRRWVSPALMTWVLGWALLAQSQQGYLPGSGNYQPYQVSAHDRQAAAIIAQIPPTAKVSAQDKLDPHVAGRETIYIYPRVDDADTILIDVTGPAWPQHPNDLYQEIQQHLAGEFGVIDGQDGYLLLSKEAPNDHIPDSFYSAFRRPTMDQSTANGEISTFGDKLTLLDHNVLLDEHGETIVQLFWQLAAHPVTEEYRIYVAFADLEGAVLHDTRFYPPVATLWYPTSLWQDGETVIIQTLPWTAPVAQFTLFAGVYQQSATNQEDGWTTGPRLQIKTEPTPVRLLSENQTVVRLGSYQYTRDGWLAVPLPQTLMQEKPPIRAHFGTDRPLFRLDGVEIETLPTSAGEDLTFSLAWHAEDGIVTEGFDYALFAHLLNAEGEKVAQLDWQPHDVWGPRPMTTWIAGSTIVDRQTLPLPPNLPAGNYRLIIGVYNWQNGERLAVFGEDHKTEDVLTITQFSID